MGVKPFISQYLGDYEIVVWIRVPLVFDLRSGGGEERERGRFPVVAAFTLEQVSAPAKDDCEQPSHAERQHI